jgi:hypothetical protein
MIIRSKPILNKDGKVIIKVLNIIRKELALVISLKILNNLNTLSTED